MGKSSQITRPASGGVVTHTTARIAGEQVGHVSAVHARTDQAAVTVVWGGVILRFLSAAAAATVLEGFAAVRAVMMGVDNTAPEIRPGEDTYAVPTVSLTWTWPTSYAVVKRHAYSEVQRRTVHWVELHMGPVTWQIFDHTGYHAVLEILRQAHRTAVAVCLDGGKWRADPTREDYKRPK